MTKFGILIVLAMTSCFLIEARDRALATPASSLQTFRSPTGEVTLVARRGRAVARRSVNRTAVTHAHRNVVHNHGVNRTVVRNRRVNVNVNHAGWTRPAAYRWRPGGAVAAGVALGFVSAATAVAWAGAPPAPGLCWYYTDPSRTQGFWDACP